MLSGGRLHVSSRFVLLHEAVSGTMSSFYMARDLHTGQVVGLKILDPGKTAAFDSRFKGLHKPCEGEIAMQLKDPRIVETFEHGHTTEGAQYIVMEFLEGPNMNTVLAARDPCLEGRRARYIRQTAEAVAAVHAAGYIHRDICPRNLLLNNSKQDLKLIDFGLTVPATRWFMQPGNRTGTLDYMAPELVHRRSTDQRLDVFAFGVTAYEVCAFELPWQHGAAMAHDQPPTDIRKHCPSIHPILAKAIHACIEPEVAQRCPSIEACLRMVQDVPDDGGLR
jgi:serine/threonine-protein kinase